MYIFTNYQFFFNRLKLIYLLIACVKVMSLKFKKYVTYFQNYVKTLVFLFS